MHSILFYFPFFLTAPPPLPIYLLQSAGNSLFTGMQLPKISVAVMFGVVMLQLASISAVDGCAHPGGCVSCGFGGSGKSYRLKGDDNAVSTVKRLRDFPARRWRLYY